jgi:hypothetical protein
LAIFIPETAATLCADIVGERRLVCTARIQFLDVCLQRMFVAPEPLPVPIPFR